MLARRLSKDPAVSVIMFASMLSLYACNQHLGAMQSEEPKTSPPSAAIAMAQPTENAAAEADVFEKRSITTDVIGPTGQTLGKMTATSAPSGLLLRVSLPMAFLTPGWHGLHLHQNADCSDIGAYKVSGGHVGKMTGGHGLLNVDGPEAGDLPNIHVGVDGSAYAEMFTSLTTLDTLEASGGFAMIIHAGPDDHETQPIGGAGARVACAAVKF